MTNHGTSDVRNVALVGHGHSGKTSLAEAMLFVTGQVKRLGSTDQGSATTDYSEDEHHAKTTLRLGLAHAIQGDTKLNLLDSPGYGNFIHDAKVALSVTDTALILVDAVAGVEVQTSKVWRFAEELKTPARVIVLNKMNRENADFDRAVASVRERFGREATPVQLPIGAAETFKGVVDLLTGKAHVSPGDGSKTVEVGEPPVELADAVATQREALAEMIAESDEELMERFLEEGELSDEDLKRGLAKAVASGAIYPITCTAADVLIGIQPLLDLIVNVCPPPTVRAELASADGESSRACADDQPVSVQIFKTLLDPFAGRLSIFRVMSGKLAADNTLHNATRGSDERCGAPLVLQGKEQTKATELHAGDIGCFVKLKETLTGDTLSDKASPIEYAPLPIQEPPMSFAIEAKNQGDEEKIGNALHKISEEDVMLRYRFDPQTKELVVSGAGERHMGVVVDRLKSRFKVEVVLHPPRVPYLETITKPASGSYRHKKQTGGAGQFAEVHMEIKPQPRGEGFEYDTSRIFGGSISQNFFPSIEKGLRQVLETGPVAGCPVVDVRCEVFDGKMHPVDSKDIAFQIAGRQLMRQLILQAKPILLEPIMSVAVFVPEECMGDVMGDLSGRRGKVQGMETEGGSQVIRAHVPMKEMLTYQAQLKSVTGGRGDFHMELDHYDQVPAQIQQEIVAASKKSDTSHEDD